MDSKKTHKHIQSLHILAMVNIVIWTIAMIAFVILLQKGGSFKGMFVIIAGGTGVGIQILGLAAQLKKVPC